MKITAQVDTYVSTPWGAAITVKAGEIREVGNDLGYECLHAGCTEVKDVTPEPKPKSKAKAAPKKKKATKKKEDIIIEV